MRVWPFLAAVAIIGVPCARGAVPCPCPDGWVRKATHTAHPCPGKPVGERGVRGPIILMFEGREVSRSDGPTGEITLCLGEEGTIGALGCTDMDLCVSVAPNASPCDWFDFQVSSTFTWTADPLIGRPAAVQVHPFPSHGDEFALKAQTLGTFTVTFTASEGPASNPDGSPICRSDDGPLSASVRVVVAEPCDTWPTGGEDLRRLVDSVDFQRQSPPYRHCPECVGPGGTLPCNAWLPMVFMPQGLPLAASHYSSSGYVHPGIECEFLTVECKTEGSLQPQTDLFFHYRRFGGAGATEIGHCIFPSGCNTVYAKVVPARCGGKSRIAETLHLVQSPWPCPNGLYKFRVTRYRVYAGVPVPEEYSVFFGTSSVRRVKDPTNPGQWKYIKNHLFELDEFLRAPRISIPNEATSECPPPTDSAPS